MTVSLFDEFLLGRQGDCVIGPISTLVIRGGSRSAVVTNLRSFVAVQHCSVKTSATVNL